MNTEKQRPGLKKIIQNIALIAWAVIFWMYVILTIVFWYKGAPERFFEYEITEKGTVEINYCSAPFFMLNIPDTIEGRPVTSIETLFGFSYIDDGKSNFMRHYVTAIHLPDTVEELHISAFDKCTNLRTINMPSNLKYAGCHILRGTKVSKLVFPEGITEIGYGEDIDCGHLECVLTFADMKYLRRVEFPKSLKKIGNNAFANCRSLKKINIPDGVEEISCGAFQNSGIKQANFPKSLTTYIGCIFNGTPFEKTLEKQAKDGFVIYNDVYLYKYVGDDENVVIPDGIESICDMAFNKARSVKTVEFPKSLKKIGNNAFANCISLKKIKIPDGVEEISYGAFQNSGIKQANFPKSLTTYNGCIFNGTPFEETLGKKAKDGFIIYNDVYLYKYVGNDENVVIPDGIESICDMAFNKARSVKTVEFPKSVKHIDSAFEYSSVESLDIPDTVDTEYLTFSGSTKLKSITLPNNIKKIQYGAFEDCVSLESIVIPESVEEIGCDAFRNCVSLKKVVREGTPKIADDAFENCTSLTVIPRSN